jgi:hypothetical protein
MMGQPTRIGMLRIAVILAALFNLVALLVLLRDTPIPFALFMFFGQPLFVIALILLGGAVLADLRTMGHAARSGTDSRKVERQ